MVKYYMSGLDGNSFISLYRTPEHKVYSIGRRNLGSSICKCITNFDIIDRFGNALSATDAHGSIFSSEVTVAAESRMSEEVIKELAAKGYSVSLIGELGCGNMVQAILVDQEHGTWTAGVDTRGEAYTIGW